MACLRGTLCVALLASTAAAQQKAGWTAVPSGEAPEECGVDDWSNVHTLLDPATGLCDPVFYGGVCHAATLIENFKEVALGEEEAKWKEICTSDRQTVAVNVCVDGALDPNVTFYKHPSYPITNKLSLLTQYHRARTGLCTCRGGTMTGDVYGMSGNCSVDIECMWEPDACYTPSSFIDAAGKNVTCPESLMCAKHVSNARGLFLGVAIEADSRALGVGQCVEHWQKCLFRTDTCLQRLCYDHGEAECDFMQHCRDAAAGAGGLEPGIYGVLVATLAIFAMLW